MSDTTTSSNSENNPKTNTLDDKPYTCICGVKYAMGRTPFFCDDCVKIQWGWKPPKKEEEPKKARGGNKKKVHVIGTPPPKVRWGPDAEKAPSPGKSQYDQDG